ncbi:hypothetical protein ACQPWW_12745 [Micromonospora sp. CA-240977]|uniref:hypothetical protein n=1 Tax=Micromonospora sp. CA-240977 TaxID=3239957 RepID=UPI003D8D88E8
MSRTGFDGDIDVPRARALGLQPAFALSLQSVEDEVESDVELFGVRVTGFQSAIHDHFGEVRELVVGQLFQD